MSEEKPERGNIREGVKQAGATFFREISFLPYVFITFSLFYSVPIYLDMLRKGDFSFQFVPLLNMTGSYSVYSLVAYTTHLKFFEQALSHRENGATWRYVLNYHLLMLVVWCLGQLVGFPLAERFLTPNAQVVVQGFFILLTLASGSWAAYFEPRPKGLVGGVVAGMKRASTEEAAQAAQDALAEPSQLGAGTLRSNTGPTVSEAARVAELEELARRNLEIFDEERPST